MSNKRNQLTTTVQAARELNSTRPDFRPLAFPWSAHQLHQLKYIVRIVIVVVIVIVISLP